MKRPAAQRFAVPLTAVAVAVALLALLVYGVTASGEGSSLDDAVKAGERPEAPSRPLPTLQASPGQELSVRSLRGRVVVLNFWASWCKPCEEEAPALNRIQRRLARSGGTVLGVAFRDTRSDSVAFTRRHGLRYPSVRDVDGLLARDYDVNALPETFVIDPRGRIVAIARGQVDDAFLTRAVREASS